MSKYKPLIQELLGEWAGQEAERQARPGSLSTPEHKREQIIDSLSWNVEEFVGRLLEGLETLTVHNSTLGREIDREAYEKMTSDPEATITLFQENRGLADALSIKKPHLLEFYNKATTLYGQNHFGKSADCFFTLCMLSPMVPAFWQGLGYAEEQCGRLDSAAYAYAMTAELQSDDLSPCLEAVRCLIQLNKKDEAKPLLDFLENNASQEVARQAVSMRQKL